MEKILITGKIHPSAIQQFKSLKSYQVIYEPDVRRERLEDLISDCLVIVTRSETKLDNKLIDRAQKLKIIARAAVGVSNIDIDYATEKGILVINTPGKNTNSAAEHTMGLMLSMMRKIPQAFIKMKSGGWDRHLFSGFELKDKCIGLLGLGNVGHRVAKFAKGFDMQVYAYDPYIAPKLFTRHGVVPSQSPYDLASQVSILSCHVPLNKETKGMIDRKVLEKLPEGSYIVNTSRGGVVNENDLLKELDKGKILGCAFDTWEDEPLPKRELVEHPLVWCSPHIGASTLEAQKKIGQTIFEQVHKALGGGVVDFPVNLPQVTSIDNPYIVPYATLAEKIGTAISQIRSFNPTSLEISYRGDLVNVDKGLIKLGLMKGYVNFSSNAYVSYVNASSHFKTLGLELLESDIHLDKEEKSAMLISLKGDKGDLLKIGGIVYDQKYMRLTTINDFYFDIKPTGTFLIIENEDQPGVIGDIGSQLASSKININSFDLSRREQGGDALAIIQIDTLVGRKNLEDLKKVNHIKSVKQIVL